MSQNSYIRAYDLEETIAASGRSVNCDGKLSEAVDSVMKVRVDKPYYSTYQIEIPGLIGFGKQCGTAYPNTNEMLLLSLRHRNFLGWARKTPVVGLRYFVYDISNMILIDHVQTPANVNLKKYQALQEKLGVKPHEALVAHFLARLRPVLDNKPTIKVSFACRRNQSKIYAALRDRFLDKSYVLNPNKERVRQILGEDNMWIKLRTGENHA